MKPSSNVARTEEHVATTFQTSTEATRPPSGPTLGDSVEIAVDEGAFIFLREIYRVRSAAD